MLDLAPTILHYMGLTVPTYMDGKVLAQAFSEGFNGANPIRYNDERPTSLTEDTGYAEGEEEAVMEKLRDMGYVG